MNASELLESLASADPDADLSFEVDGVPARFDHALVEGTGAVIVSLVTEATKGEPAAEPASFPDPPLPDPIEPVSTEPTEPPAV